MSEAPPLFDDGSRLMLSAPKKSPQADASSTMQRLPDFSVLPCTFEEYYDIAATAAYIAGQSVSGVALQFPDHLLPHAARVSDALVQTALEAHSLTLSACILADTSYGSCCVDQTAAAHR